MQPSALLIILAKQQQKLCSGNLGPLCTKQYKYWRICILFCGITEVHVFQKKKENYSEPVKKNIVTLYYSSLKISKFQIILKPWLRLARTSRYITLLVTYRFRSICGYACWYFFGLRPLNFPSIRYWTCFERNWQLNLALQTHRSSLLSSPWLKKFKD